jgi:hypothetical protein
VTRCVAWSVHALPVGKSWNTCVAVEREHDALKAALALHRPADGDAAQVGASEQPPTDQADVRNGPGSRPGANGISAGCTLTGTSHIRTNSGTEPE